MTKRHSASSLSGELVRCWSSLLSGCVEDKEDLVAFVGSGCPVDEEHGAGVDGEAEFFADFADTGSAG